MQILMSIMMATFMLVLVPRAAVCAERLTEVLETESSVVPPRAPLTHGLGARRRSSCATRPSATPAPTHPSLRDISFTARPGQVTAIIGSTGAGKTTLLSLIPRLFDATGGSVLVDGVDVTQLDPELLHDAHRARARRRRTCSPARSRATSATASPTRPTTSCGTALRIAQAEDFVRALAEGLRRARRPGRHELLRRPAAAARHRSGDRAPTGDLPLRRLVLGARPRHRRPAAGRAAADGRRLDGAHRGAAGLDIIDADQILVLDDGSLVGAGTHEELLGVLPDLRRDRRVAAPGRGGSMSQQTAPRPPSGCHARTRAAMMSAGMPAEKSLDFWPSAEAAARPAAARARPGARSSLAAHGHLGDAERARPAHPRCTPRTSSSRGSSVSSCRPGMTQQQAIDAARASGQDGFANLLSGMTVVPGPGHRLHRARPDVLLLVLVLYVAGVARPCGRRRRSSTASSSAPS